MQRMRRPERTVMTTLRRRMMKMTQRWKKKTECWFSPTATTILLWKARTQFWWNSMHHGMFVAYLVLKPFCCCPCNFPPDSPNSPVYLHYSFVLLKVRPLQTVCTRVWENSTDPEGEWPSHPCGQSGCYVVQWVGKQVRRVRLSHH